MGKMEKKRKRERERERVFFASGAMLRTFSLASRAQGCGRINRGNLILSKCQTSKIKCRQGTVARMSPAIFLCPAPALFHASANIPLKNFALARSAKLSPTVQRDDCCVVDGEVVREVRADKQ